MKIENQIRGFKFIQLARDQNLHPAGEEVRHEVARVTITDQGQPDLIVCCKPVESRKSHHQIAKLAQAKGRNREAHGCTARSIDPSPELC
jgi:hypothetical protein